MPLAAAHAWPILEFAGASSPTLQCGTREIRGGLRVLFERMIKCAPLQLRIAWPEVLGVFLQCVRLLYTSSRHLNIEAELFW